MNDSPRDLQLIIPLAILGLIGLGLIAFACTLGTYPVWAWLRLVQYAIGGIGGLSVLVAVVGIFFPANKPR